jgi:hypothetical protein
MKWIAGLKAGVFRTIQHLSVLLVLMGLAYLLIRFFGVGGGYMLAVPAIFVIYLGVCMLFASKPKNGASL